MTPAPRTQSRGLAPYRFSAATAAARPRKSPFPLISLYEALRLFEQFTPHLTSTEPPKVDESVVGKVRLKTFEPRWIFLALRR